MPDTPIGVVYNTSMTRPDAALALAAMYESEIKRDSKIGAVCVAGAAFNAALFCDIIGRMYTFGGNPNGNQSLAVGMSLEPGIVDSAMVKFAVERRNEKGDPQYRRTLQRVNDTSLPDALLRNGVIFNAESAVILSGPATYLAKSLDLLNAKELYKARVKRLVIVNAGTPYKDAAALKKVIAEWPTPVFYVGKEVGDALLFPAAKLDKFSWAPAHPVVDAYRAYRTMPYDAPLYDLAATYYTIHPTSDLFQLSPAGSVAVADDGAMKFVLGSGTVHSVNIDPAKKDQLLTALIDLATSQPVQPAPQQRGGRGGSGRGAFGFSGGRGVIPQPPPPAAVAK